MKLRKEQTAGPVNWVEFNLNTETGQKVDLDSSKDEKTKDLEQTDKTIKKDDVDAHDVVLENEIEEKVSDEPEFETIRICLRYLRVAEINDMQTEVYQINAEMKGRRSGSVTSKFNYGLYMEKKMEFGIAEWENILDEDGKPAEVNIENIRALPGWVGESLIEIIDEMNDIGTEIKGEF